MPKFFFPLDLFFFPRKALSGYRTRFPFPKPPSFSRPSQGAPYLFVQSSSCTTDFPPILPFHARGDRLFEANSLEPFFFNVSLPPLTRPAFSLSRIFRLFCTCSCFFFAGGLPRVDNPFFFLRQGLHPGFFAGRDFPFFFQGNLSLGLSSRFSGLKSLLFLGLFYPADVLTLHVFLSSPPSPRPWCNVFPHFPF